MVVKFYLSVSTNWHKMMDIMVLIKLLMNNTTESQYTLPYAETDRVLETKEQKEITITSLTISHDVRAQVAKPS